MQYKDISVIIPAFNEETNIKSSIDSAKQLNPLEIIVVDGGSTDRTCELAKNTGAKLIKSAKGRGAQMNAGASLAQGEILLFLHADSRLPLIDYENAFGEEMKDYAGGFLKLKFDDTSISTKLVELFANVRSRLFSLPYGDQAIFLKRDVFEKIGGFKEYPFLEDIDMAMRLRKSYRLKYMPYNVTASARRLKKGYPLSPVAVSFKNVFIAILFMLGVSPHKLIHLYR
jgi:rSAM/selenodomain-associated transferase 2